MAASRAISGSELRQRLGAFPPPTIVDVRRAAAFDQDPVIIPGALRRQHDQTANWGPDLDAWRPVVVYCVHGHEVSQGAAQSLAAAGLDAHYLAGGLADWRAQGDPTAAFVPSTRWVTRARPKIDRIACPWLVRRFIDPSAEFHYVPNAEVMAFAQAHGAVPFDVPDVPYSHVGDACSFDAFIRLHRLEDPALRELAAIVRGADTGALALAAQASGLLAISLGLSAIIADDRAMLRAGLLVYDALYAWCREVRGETHGWNPAALRVPS